MVILGSTALTLRVKTFETSPAGLLSVTRTMPVSFAEGVPVIFALSASNREIPCGREPSSFHVRGFVPVPLMVSVYFLPAAASLRDLVVISGSVQTLSVSVLVSLP